MDHPRNILDNIKAFFTLKRGRYFLFNLLFIVIRRLTPHNFLSKCKKLHNASKSPDRDFSISRGDPIGNLELRRMHPFFVKYHVDHFFSINKNHEGKKVKTFGYEKAEKSERVIMSGYKLYNNKRELDL
jgi:hypothetical protein